MMYVLFNKACLEETPAKVLAPVGKPSEDDPLLVTARAEDSSTDGDDGGPTKTRRTAPIEAITQTIPPMMMPATSRYPSFLPEEVQLLNELLADDDIFSSIDGTTTSESGGSSLSDGDFDVFTSS